MSARRVIEFQEMAGKPIAWAYFSDNWTGGIRFPAEAASTVRRQGCIPFIRMMPRSSFGQEAPDPVYTMHRILGGEFDAALIQWARDAKEFDFPLMVEFGPEANGSWFPWSGLWNGGGTTTGYGDPSMPDGPERFRDAYRRIIDLFRAEGADNITWVFHVDANASPDEPWNCMAGYYPGDEYIDWIGISVYGAQFPGDDWEPFTAILDAAYPEFAAISAEKPLAVLEFGVAEDPERGDKASWIRNALRAVSAGRYHRLRAVSYWHENWPNDDGSVSMLRIDSSASALRAYKEGIGNPFFTTRPRYSAGMPAVNIRVNGSNGPLTLGPTEQIFVTLDLDPGYDAGVFADWLAAARTQWGWYRYDARGGKWMPGLAASHQGPLFSLVALELPAISALPPGRCAVYLAIDTTMNGKPDYDRIYFDSVAVTR